MTISRAFRRAVVVSAFAILPALITVWGLWIGSIAWDFHHELYPQAKLMLEGQNPYPAGISGDDPVKNSTNKGCANLWVSGQYQKSVTLASAARRLAHAQATIAAQASPWTLRFDPKTPMVAKSSTRS